MKKRYDVQQVCLKGIIALLLLVVTYTADCQSFYEQIFSDVDGKEVRLADFANKKILFIVLPVDPSDSLVVELTHFVTSYKVGLQVIGVLSQEDGHSQLNKADVKERYNKTGILVTDLMLSRKGNGQSPVMKWLTSKQENGHFDMDVKSVGQKFFVNGNGKLYAVLGPNSSLFSPFVQKVVTAMDSIEQPVSNKGQTKP